MGRGAPVAHSKELPLDSTENPLTVQGRGLMWSALPSPTTRPFC